MQPMKWNKKHEVFVPELDAEHRNLFRIGDELRVAMGPNGDGEHVRALLSALTAEAEEHLRHEERLMRAAQYPSYEWHRKQHDTLRKGLKGFTKQIEAGDNQALEALLQFLTSWMNDHTSLADRMMGAYIRNHRRLHSVMAS